MSIYNNSTSSAALNTAASTSSGAPSNSVAAKKAELEKANSVGTQLFNGTTTAMPATVFAASSLSSSSTSSVAPAINTAAAVASTQSGLKEKDSAKMVRDANNTAADKQIVPVSNTANALTRIGRLTKITLGIMDDNTSFKIIAYTNIQDQARLRVVCRVLNRKFNDERYYQFTARILNWNLNPLPNIPFKAQFIKVYKQILATNAMSSSHLEPAMLKAYKEKFADPVTFFYEVAIPVKIRLACQLYSDSDNNSSNGKAKESSVKYVNIEDLISKKEERIVTDSSKFVLYLRKIYERFKLYWDFSDLYSLKLVANEFIKALNLKKLPDEEIISELFLSFIYSKYLPEHFIEQLIKILGKDFIKKKFDPLMLSLYMGSNVDSFNGIKIYLKYFGTKEEIINKLNEQDEANRIVDDTVSFKTDSPIDKKDVLRRFIMIREYLKTGIVDKLLEDEERIDTDPSQFEEYFSEILQRFRLDEDFSDLDSLKLVAGEFIKSLSVRQLTEDEKKCLNLLYLFIYSERLPEYFLEELIKTFGRDFIKKELNPLTTSLGTKSDIDSINGIKIYLKYFGTNEEIINQITEREEALRKVDDTETLEIREGRSIISINKKDLLRKFAMIRENLKTGNIDKLLETKKKKAQKAVVKANNPGCCVIS